MNQNHLQNVIRRLEQQIHDATTALNRADHTNTRNRFTAIFSVLVSYADQHAGTNLQSAIVYQGVPYAAVGLVATILSKKELYPVRAMLFRWQGSPERIGDYLTLVEGVIPVQGFKLDWGGGRVEHVTTDTPLWKMSANVLAPVG